MNYRKASIAVAALALLGAGCSMMPPSSSGSSGGGGYWRDASGAIVRNSSNQCWRSGTWTPQQAIPECEGGVKPAPVAVPVTPPAPPPEPVAAPAPPPPPPPPPVVVAPPSPPPPAPVVPVAPPPPSYRTLVTEKPVSLEGANFAPGSSRLLPGANARLSEVVNAARQYPEINLSVVGYTDNTGSAAANNKLSKGRAEAVKTYLTSQGVAANRITTEGKGAADPVADNKTADGRAKNRRVEIRYTIKEETRVRVPR